MGNRTSGEAPRTSNYNTINRSNRSKREERRQKQRKVLVLICLVFILLLCLYLFLIFSQIASTARNNRNHPVDTEDTKDSSKQTDDTGSDTGDHPLPPVAGYVGTTRTAADVHTGNLLQLDAAHPLNETAQKSALLNLKVIPSALKYRAETDYVPNKLMPEVIDALTAMLSAMQADGLTDLAIVSAYKPAGTYAPYRTGYAVGLKVYVGDVQYKMFDVPNAKCKPEYGEWLLANSCKYGFLISDRDTGNEQAFRYYGIANATYMKEHGLEDLEDYLNVLRTMTSAEGMHLQVSANGSEYECYYVPANASGNTTVQVPADNDTVTVSGDNVSGFVVSYKVG